MSALNEVHGESRLTTTTQINTQELMNITVEEFEKQVNQSGDVFYKEILERIKCLQMRDKKNLNEAVRLSIVSDTLCGIRLKS